jgi:hypothetical protein
MEVTRMVSRAVVVVALVLAMAACAAPPLRIESEQAAATDLGRLRTYAWLPTDTPKMAATRETVAPHVDRQLQAKGYALAAGAPDFQVSSEIVVERKVETSRLDVSVPGQPGYRAPGGPVAPQTISTVREYSEGTLIITVVDPASKRPIWRGWAEAQIRPSATPQQRSARLAEAVEKILERFPSRR